MPLGTEVGLGPGDFVLDGDPAPLPKRGRSPKFSAHVYYGQTAGWIKMVLGMEVGLSPGDFVLDGDPAAPFPKKGTEHPPQFLAHFCCSKTAGCIKMSLGIEIGLRPKDFVSDGDPAPSPKRGRPSPQFTANVYCGQTAALIKMLLGREVGLGPDYIVLDGDPAPLRQKGGGAPCPISACLFWPNVWMDQDGTWHGGGPWSRPHCARWGPSSPPQKGYRAPNFRPIFNVAKRLDASRCHLVWRYASAQAT